MYDISFVSSILLPEDKTSVTMDASGNLPVICSHCQWECGKIKEATVTNRNQNYGTTATVTAKEQRERQKIRI